jgi:hypothetical protein
MYELDYEANAQDTTRKNIEVLIKTISAFGFNEQQILKGTAAALKSELIAILMNHIRTLTPGTLPDFSEFMDYNK